MWTRESQVKLRKGISAIEVALQMKSFRRLGGYSETWSCRRRTRFLRLSMDFLQMSRIAAKKCVTLSRVSAPNRNKPNPCLTCGIQRSST